MKVALYVRVSRRTSHFFAAQVATRRTTSGSTRLNTDSSRRSKPGIAP